jgi:predicted O-methyltransferase YrrM
MMAIDGRPARWRGALSSADQGSSVVAQFRTSVEGASRFATIYKTVLSAYADLGYPTEIVNTWAIGPHDAPDLMAIAESVQPAKILEVGTYVGVSTMLLALTCPNAHIFTVDPDLPLEIEMGATGSSVANVDSSATTHAIARAAAEKLGVADRITFVKGGYAVRETFSSTLTSSGAKARLAGPKLCKDEGPFDFVFIDGLHTSEAVAADLQLSSSHLTPSGIMALHDCVGFWGANVRAGVLEFIRRNPSYRFMHPPYADLWRGVGVVAKGDSKAIDRSHFAAPMTEADNSDALRATFSTLLSTTFGGRDVLEVSVGVPMLKTVAAPGRHVSVRVLGGRGARNLNAELDKILSQFDKLDAPVLFSADLLDFSPPELTQNLLAAVAHRKGELMLAVTPPGEEKIAGPESRPVSWLVDMVRAHRFAAYGLPQLDLEPARYSLLPEMREFGRNSRFASTVVIGPRGGIVDGKRRKLVELTPALAAEREQAELQRVHLASGYRRFFNDSNAASAMLQEQSRQLHQQITVAQEAGQREKRWREENTESLNGQLARQQEEYQRVVARSESLAAEVAARDTLVAARDATIAELTKKLSETTQDGGQSKSLLDSLASESRAREATLVELSQQLQTALEAGQREKVWREEAAASFDVQIERLSQVARAAEDRIGPLELQVAQAQAMAEDLGKQLETALASAQQEKAWRLEAAAAYQAHVADLIEQYRGAVAREAGLKAQNEASIELARLESGLRTEKEERLRRVIEEMAAADRERDATRSATDAVYQDRLRQADLDLLNALEARSAMELELARIEGERRAASVREASLQHQLRTHEEITKFELDARDQREKRLWNNLQELTEAERRDSQTRAVIESALQDRLKAAEGDLLRMTVERDALRQELGEEIEHLSATLSIEREAKVKGAAAIDGLTEELALERQLRAELEARAGEGGALVDQLSSRLSAMVDATEAGDTSTRDQLRLLAERLDTIRSESDDYLARLVDVYHAMDSFEALVSAGEAALGEFESGVLGLAVEPVIASAQGEASEGLDATNTIAEIERLKGRWQNVLARLSRSAEAGAARVQQLESKCSEAEQRLLEAEEEARRSLAAIETDAALRLAEFDAAFRRQHSESLEIGARTERQLVESQAFLESQLAELRGALETRTSEGQDISARLSVLNSQNADFTQRLIEVYQALDEIDGAVIEQLRMCNETEVQLLGSSEPAGDIVTVDDGEDHLMLLRHRSRALSSKISRLHLVSNSRFHSSEEASRNLQSIAAALEAQIKEIRQSTTWRALAPVRMAGKPVRGLRRRVGANLRGRELLKLKAELDARLKPAGVECPVFDAQGYAERYGDVPAHLALRHYLTFGENEGRMPTHRFDPAFYYRMYPDVQAARASALLHFLRHGIHEGRSPSAAMHPLGVLAAEKGMTPLEYFAKS